MRQRPRLNPTLTPRQPSACSWCDFPEHLHTGTIHPWFWTYLVCATYQRPDGWLIKERMLDRRTWPSSMRWNVGRSEDR